MKERGGVWGGGRFGVGPLYGPQRMTGSAASTLVVSRRWEFLFERPLWRDRVHLSLHHFLCRKIKYFKRPGRGLGRGRFGIGR